MKKVVILIDGQNLFYGLKSMSLKERDISWTKLFQSFMESNDELIRTYWFRPQKIQDSHLTPEAIRNQIVYKQFRNYYDVFRTNKSTIPATTISKIEEEVNKVEKWISDERQKFQAIEYNYDQLSLEHSNIEIVKKGIVKVNPFKQEYNGEKGVDIALAVKMISLSVENKCDKIILLSGDYDYAEAIQYVKNNMTKIHIAKFHKGYPPKNKNMSRDLSVLADRVLDVYETDLKSTYLMPSVTIPLVTTADTV